EEAVGDELDRRRVADDEPALRLQRRELPAEVTRDRTDLRRRFLQRKEASRLSTARAFEEAVEAPERLARPGAALAHRRPAPWPTANSGATLMSSDVYSPMSRVVVPHAAMVAARSYTNARR